MSSTNEEISPPPKPKTSPLEFRNTDLVSRLLAATPPYLYNMPLVPHSYFFSEMLRSLVQGKTEAAARMSSQIPHRRARKRTWPHPRSDHYPAKQISPNVKSDSLEMPPPNWTPKLMDKTELPERPLELTMNKIPLNNNTKMCHSESQLPDVRNNISPHKMNEKPEMHPLPPSNHVPLPYSQNLSSTETSSTSSDLILPPPPPIWYPPLYPTPYGIDPLHFFIDLRVSGHIYDRKNSKELPNMNMNLSPHSSNSQISHLPMGSSMNMMDVNNLNSNSTITSSESYHRESLLKNSRHSSAFTVPIPSTIRNDPLNLSGNKFRFNDEKPAKFDIKSMGFDNSDSKNTNYVLKNLSKIYKDIHEMKQQVEGIDLTSTKNEDSNDGVNVKNEKEETKDDDKDDKEKEKKCKDLRALIGLELVVDYVKHEVKPGKQSSEDDSTTDLDSNISSPAVEVVTVSETDNNINI